MTAGGPGGTAGRPVGVSVQVPGGTGKMRSSGGARLAVAGDTAPQPFDVERLPQEPVRTCVGCRGRAQRSVLLRVVAAEVDGAWCVVPDPRRRLGGRGAWLHPEPACLDLAERRKAFPRALRRSGPLGTGALRTFVTGPPTVPTGSGSDADEHPMSAR